MSEPTLVVTGEVEISEENVERAEQWLRDHGIEDPCTVLQELGFILLDADLEFLSRPAGTRKNSSLRER